LIEGDKLIVNDFNTISELTTFVANKTSFAAESDSNDDLAMTLVIFAWVSTQKYFRDIVAHDIRQQIQLENMNQLDDENLPAPIIDDGREHYFEILDGDVWVTADSGEVYSGFFKELMSEMSKKEDFLMKKQQKEIDRLMSGSVDNRRMEEESRLTPFEIFQTRYIHLQVCSPDHPLFKKYHQEFKKVDYNKNYELWKEEYYKYYLNIDKSNEEEYLSMRINLVRNYLESVMFNLKYYFQGCPSWQWHYKFRISPLLSDIHYVLENNIVDMNTITFIEGSPYTPFQQYLYFTHLCSYLMNYTLLSVLSSLC
jgi:hypothetical protein